MENASTARTHPLVLAAAASVLVVSAAAFAVAAAFLIFDRPAHPDLPMERRRDGWIGRDGR
jgi:hypothetical protein